jgi:hypothetical protein
LSLTANSSDVEGSTTVARQRGGRSRRKFRYVVNVDGEEFAVENLAEAQELLLQVQELAKDPVIVTKTIPRVRVLTASGKPTTAKKLAKAVKETQSVIERAFKRKSVDAEIGELLEKKIALEAQQAKDARAAEEDLIAKLVAADQSFNQILAKELATLAQRIRRGL